ncbi:hypothetical protein [Sphingomonas sp.]|uniref:hypothetical protein n=1 Tax=Sphingomonas sp. TaxID=28214 RepID=UPI002EDB7149
MFIAQRLCLERNQTRQLQGDGPLLDPFRQRIALGFVQPDIQYRARFRWREAQHLAGDLDDLARTQQAMQPDVRPLARTHQQPHPVGQYRDPAPQEFVQRRRRCAMIIVQDQCDRIRLRIQRSLDFANDAVQHQLDKPALQMNRQIGDRHARGLQ